jgi:hypothetical protein
MKANTPASFINTAPFRRADVSTPKSGASGSRDRASISFAWRGARDGQP